MRSFQLLSWWDRVHRGQEMIVAIRIIPLSNLEFPLIWKVLDGGLRHAGVSLETNTTALMRAIHVLCLIHPTPAIVP
jgi:hypothetical protein